MPKEWPQWLSLDELWYNTSYHSSMHMPFYEAVYGQQPPSLLPYMLIPNWIWLIGGSRQEKPH
ncbi:hypothetical protein KY290_013516 [Solanum tuberosum]|uniref:Uncharacterized protein n=1 Tax=Solanum tuberosum TaxID=4113 RepID=A0ABQ7VML4_SOLTU|nr:hypothetical protein KY289_013626 [Solanum tuberosum]KAH0716948.1 hypothetical protein KY285_012979 [Solanum tuberosum]KAH0769535.1 hypothetical protein KY290_013516 [Solanum tuberosum]